MSPDEDALRVGWEAVLAVMEQDAVRQTVGSADGAGSADERAAAGARAAGAPAADERAAGERAAATWTEPTGLGPMPRELVGRASRLVAAQRDRMAGLEAERAAVLEHLGALRAVDATREPRGAVYLDASA